MEDARPGGSLQPSCPPLQLIPLSKNPKMKSTTSKFSLPTPTLTPPDPSKKSHARKQPVGHIPRPRNAFILFRCDFVRQEKIPESVENDHRNISRIVGKIWREMTDEQKRPWVEMAEEEKHVHLQANPNYRFNPGIPNTNPKKKPKRGDDVPRETQEDNLSLDENALALQRAASCPVGALRVPQANLESFKGYGTRMITRDDLARRPSRVAVYQSAPYDLEAKLKDLDCYSDIANQYHFAEALSTEQPTADNSHHKNKNDLPVGSRSALFCGPRFDPRGGANALLPPPGEGTLLEWNETRSNSANVVAFDDWLSSNHSVTEPEPYFMDVLRSSLPMSMEPRPNLPYPIVESAEKERDLPSFQSPSGGWRLPPLPLSSGSSICSPLATSSTTHLDADNAEDRRLDYLHSLDHAEVFRKYFMQKERQRMAEIPQHQAK